MNLKEKTRMSRVGKGTLYGISRAKHFVRSCSRNYAKQAFILKLDVQAYFMNMQHAIIYEKVVSLLPEQKLNYLGISRETVLYLLK